MKIRFLGTAASPSMPLPFCQCNGCKQARLIRGKNLRKRSAIIINNDLLVDIGPDLMSATYEYNISIADVSICLQTHFHEDHFDPEMIISRHCDYGSVDVKELLLVASKQTLEMMDVIIGRRCGYGSIFNEQVQHSFKIKLLIMEPYKDYSIGNYIVTGYPANHGSPDHGCLLFKIGYEDKYVFYGTDTSSLYEEIWHHFELTKTQFDLIILDCTYGINFESKQGDHLAINDFIVHVQRFINSGYVKNTGQIYATHISHEGIMEHSDFDTYAIEHDFQISYDGLSIDV